MTCRTRPQPQTTWTQEGGDSTLASNVGARKAVIWTRTKMVAGVTAAILGRGAEFAYNNAGGLGAVEGNGWIAALQRYGIWSQSPGGAGGTTYHLSIISFPFKPILDPLLPVIPVILRVRDIVQVTRSAGATWGNVGFTLGGGYIFQDGSIEAYRSVGFHSYGGSTWRTYYSGNANVAAQRAFDTGRLISDVCELMFEIDGARKQVRYYIDGLLVDTFTPPIDAAAVAINRGESLNWSNKPDAGVTLRFHHGLGIGRIVELETLV